MPAEVHNGRNTATLEHVGSMDAQALRSGGWSGFDAMLGLTRQPEVAATMYGHGHNGHHHGHNHDHHHRHKEQKPEQHAEAQLQPVAGSGVSGSVSLRQLKHGGTSIAVQASGLTPG